MKVVLLGSGTSIHTIRWSNGLAAAGMELVLATQHAPAHPVDPGIRVEMLPHRGRLGYLRNSGPLRSLLATIEPDLVNAHYATGYGTLARRADFHPTLISVWGSDVFRFPDRSPLHRAWVRRNLLWADGIASTSRMMADRVRSLVPEIQQIAITPFGVDTDAFRPSDTPRPAGAPLVVGTVKTMTRKYGIDVLIRAFAMVVSDPTLPREIADTALLRIAGGGPELDAYRELARDLGIERRAEFLGTVAHAQVPEILRGLDLYAALSILDSESFGVAVIEASACGLPVVVSDAGGLPEVVSPNETGFIVPRRDPVASAAAIRRLLVDADLRRRFGDQGRRKIEREYQWHGCVETMRRAYLRLAGPSRGDAA